MKTLSIFTINLILAFCLVGSVFAQSACFQFHKTNCHPQSESKKRDSGKDFVYDTQSRSGLFSTDQKNNKSQLRFVVYKGMDYRLSVCIDQDVLGETVQFVVKDAKNNEVLFNNTEEKNTKQFEFSSAQTRSLIVEVTIPGAEGGAKNIEKGKSADGGCVGLLIEHKKSEKIGF